MTDKTTPMKRPTQTVGQRTPGRVYSVYDRAGYLHGLYRANSIEQLRQTLGDGFRINAAPAGSYYADEVRHV